MQTKLIQYAILFITTLVIDRVWIGFVAKSFYDKYLGYIMAKTPNLKAALLFYIIYVFGVLFLIISPALAQNFSTGKVFLYAAVLGLVAYSTYDLTNQALLKDWPTIVTITDIAWGIFMTAVSASISYILIKKL